MFSKNVKNAFLHWIGKLCETSHYLLQTEAVVWDYKTDPAGTWYSSFGVG